ncbi:hypothetical protein RJ639_027890 [Escallonia herrerae]|uniref:Tetraspanin-8 n=1 Tax=Escallonia herrerae TaxID=1293975 RepID=A0AA88XL59_9ASTE|nr:hypothetical protein RJ639_027890 [Escallonia herrerae]
MVRASNLFIATLNVITLALSFAAIGYSLWYLTHDGASVCQTTLQKPLLIAGSSLLVVSLMGLVGSCCRVNWLLTIYLVVMFLLILAMIGFTIFTFIVTNKGVGRVISGKGFREYRLGDYSGWLQKHAVNGENWEKIRSCLVDVHVCAGLARYQKSEDFYKRRLSSLQCPNLHQVSLSSVQCARSVNALSLSGCCKPPSYCGFQYVNATFWTAPKSGPAEPDSDCTTWSNNQRQLCYDCKSCKAGVLDYIKSQWRKLAIINICVLFIIIIIYSMGCCARQNNKASHFKRVNRGYRDWIEEKPALSMADLDVKMGMVGEGEARIGVLEKSMEMGQDGFVRQNFLKA